MVRLAAVIRLDGAPVADADVAGILRAIAVPDGAPPGLAATLEVPVRASRAAPWAILGRTGTSPPVSDPSGRLWVAFDGRIDNRVEIAARLGFDHHRRVQSTDAELFLQALDRWSDEAFQRIVGPFAAVALDTRERRVRLVRDPLGARRLFLRHDGPRLTVASAAAVLATAEGAPRFDEASVARFLALQGPEPGRTFFEDVEELPPASLISIDSRRRTRSTAVVLTPTTPHGRLREDDCAQRFRELVDEAVACRMPRGERCAVLMSGGLDSTSVATTASSEAGRLGAAPPVAISWVYRELPGIDESRWIDAVTEGARLESRRLVGDGLWPLAGEADWPWCREAPFHDLYWRLMDGSFRLAADDGCSVVLTGFWGDQLWARFGQEWLRDLLFSGQVGAALEGFLKAAAFELRGRSSTHPLRQSLGSVLRRPRDDDPSGESPWLTATALSLLHDSKARSVRGASSTDEPRRAGAFVRPYDLAVTAMLDRQADLRQIELRHPWRDRRLIEFFLGLGAEWIYRPGEPKLLLRRALADRLPAAVLRRREATSMAPLALRGLKDRAWSALRTTLDAKDAWWPKFVDRKWLSTRASPDQEPSSKALEWLVLWNCCCLERWRHALDAVPRTPRAH